MIADFYGLDTIFGGDGCDTIIAFDGGDVIWLGDCPAVDATSQILRICGTGLDPTNYTVIMDFWLDSAISQNLLCLEPAILQVHGGDGLYPLCPAKSFICLSAADV